MAPETIVMYNSTFYCTAFICILQGTQMVCPDYWILFSDVMNALFMWALQKTKSDMNLWNSEVKQKHIEEHGFCSQTLAHITVFLFLQKQRHLTCNLDYFL